MKLLFDENLSRTLVRDLFDLYPASEHVTRIGLEQGDDKRVWDYAKRNGYAIVTQDSDFAERAFLRVPLQRLFG